MASTQNRLLASILAAKMTTLGFEAGVDPKTGKVTANN
jgi:hypothetical protein